MEPNDPKILEQIMSQFEEMWPKIVHFDPEVKPYYNLMQNVYAQGMINALEVVAERMEREDVTIH
jgi:hypothetical protein